MPLEINEIGVKLAVDPDPPEPPLPAPAPNPAPGRISRIVSACVNRVLAALKSSRAR